MLSFTQFGDVKTEGTLEWGMAPDMATELQINWRTVCFQHAGRSKGLWERGLGSQTAAVHEAPECGGRRRRPEARSSQGPSP